jgi:hypothetical protein
MNAPPGPAGPGRESVAESWFEAELVAALEELAGQTRTHAFDTEAIQRRAARRRALNVGLTAAVALMMVAVGAWAAAFVRERDGTPAVGAAASQRWSVARDPLTVPVTFKTLPGAVVAGLFQPIPNATAVTNASVTTQWVRSGTQYSATLRWNAPTTAELASVQPVGSVSGRTAYESTGGLLFQPAATQWARLSVSEVDGKKTTDVTSLDIGTTIAVAQGVAAGTVAVPLPFRIDGQGVVVQTAELVSGPPYAETPWSFDMHVTIDSEPVELTVSPTSPNLVGGKYNAHVSSGGMSFVGAVSVSDGGGTDVFLADILHRITCFGPDRELWTTSVLVE